jgi:hypothetical protein
VFTTARHSFLSWARWIQPTQPYPICLRSILILSLNLYLYLPSGRPIISIFIMLSRTPSVYRSGFSAKLWIWNTYSEICHSSSCIVNRTNTIVPNKHKCKLYDILTPDVLLQTSRDYEVWMGIRKNNLAKPMRELIQSNRPREMTERLLMCDHTVSRLF